MPTYKVNDGRKKAWYWYFMTGEKVNGVYQKIKSNTGYLRQSEAASAEAKAKNAYDSNTYIADSKMTLREYLEHVYKPTKAKLSAKSVEYYAYMVDKICEAKIADKKLQKIKLVDLTTYQLSLLDTGLSDKTQYMLLSTLKGALRYACESDLIAKNPAVKLKLPPKPKPKGKHLDSDTLMAQLAIVKEFDYEIYIPILLMATASCRTIEAVGVRNCNVDLDNHTLKIENGLDYRDGDLKLVELKTPKAYRTVPLLPLAVEEIKNYKSWLRKKLLSLKTENGALNIEAWKNPLDLLVLQVTGQPMSEDFLQHRWRKLKEAHQELQNMRPYDFRHSYAANLRDAGVAMADISDLMGHTSVSFTASTYAVAIDTTHQKAAVLLEQALLKTK